MTTVRLTKRQHQLLRADVADLDPQDEREALAAELRAGPVVTVTPVLLDEVREMADRDADPADQRVYLRLLRRLSKGWRTR